MEFSRQEYWSGLPFPTLGHLPNLRIEPRSPTLQVDSLPSEPPGKPPTTTGGYHIRKCTNRTIPIFTKSSIGQRCFGALHVEINCITNCSDPPMAPYCSGNKCKTLMMVQKVHLMCALSAGRHLTQFQQDHSFTLWPLRMAPP